MIITFLAGNVLREARPADPSHLLRVKQAKIHRLTNVAVGFSPWFADFQNFQRGKFIAPPFHDCGGPLQ